MQVYRYDFKGDLNGVEVLIRVIQSPFDREFRFTTLCRCGNAKGAEFALKPERLVSLDFSGLRKAPPVQNWEGWALRANDPAGIMGRLSAARSGNNVFTEYHGFKGMTLRGRELKCSFSLTGYFHTDYAGRVISETSRLAAAFNN